MKSGSPAPKRSVFKYLAGPASGSSFLLRVPSSTVWGAGFGGVFRIFRPALSLRLFPPEMWAAPPGQTSTRLLQLAALSLSSEPFQFGLRCVPFSLVTKRKQAPSKGRERGCGLRLIVTSRHRAPVLAVGCAWGRAP